MRKFLSLLLVCLITVSVSGCAGKINFNFTTENTDEDTVETEETDAIDYGNIVTDAYSDTVNNRKIAIPKINLDSTDIDNINDEIWEKLYVSGVENKKEIPSGYGDDYISYEWYLNDDIVSLVIQDGTENEMWMNYIVYNVSADDKKKADNDDVIEKAGFTKTEYKEKAKSAVQSRFMGLYGNNYTIEEILQDEYFSEALNDSLSDENIESSCPYLNEDGQLCVIAKVYSPSFGDIPYYFADLNLVDFVPQENNYTAEATESLEENTGVIDKNLLIKEWEAEVPQDGYAFYYRLSFVSDTEVEYIAGYAFSEITYFAKGTYSLDGDLLSLKLTDENGVKSSVYKISVDDDSLTMDYVSGNEINVVQGEGTSLTYHTRVYY